MRNLTLNLDALAVDSFSAEGDPTRWAAAAPESTGCHTLAFSCVDARYPVTVTGVDPCCDDELGAAALTRGYPCDTTR